MKIAQAKQLAHPTTVMIQTTSLCNSACVICPYPSVQSENPRGDMSPGLFDSIIDEIAGFPPLRRLMLYLMNEPLCDKNIISRIRKAREKLPDTEIYILTNGIALNDRLADELTDSGLSWIGFSVHAINPETYRKITGHADFERIRNRITGFIDKAVAAKGTDFVQVNVTRVRPHMSEDEFLEAADFWKSVGLTRVDLDGGYISRAGNVEVYGHERLRRNRITGCRTLWGHEMAHILHDGTVIPCCMDWRRKVVYGNVERESLLDIWRGENRMNFLDRISSGEPLPDDFLCIPCEDAVPEKPTAAVADAPPCGVCDCGGSCEDNETDTPCEPMDETDTTSQNADILLIAPPPWLPYGPPLGLASLKAVLAQHGFCADLLDANILLFNESDDERKKLWEWEEGLFWEKGADVDRVFGDQLDRIAQQIAEHPAPVVGFSVASRKEYAIARIVNHLANLAPQKTVIFGGPGVFLREDRDRIHALVADALSTTDRDILCAFVVGEGEATLLECLQNLSNGESIENIEGLSVYRRGGQASFTPRKNIVPMESLPIPGFSGLPLDLYTHPSLTVEWSRGCIGRCVYCNVRGLWGRYRNKTAVQVVDELETLVESYNITWFSICDPVINGRPDVLEQICDTIIARDLKIKWSAGISPQRELTPAQFEKLAKAGCYRLEFGIESGSDAVLEKMGKRYEIQSAGPMIEACHNAGIETVLYLIIGFPGETEDDFQRTLDFLREHASHIDLVRSVNSLILVPGSPMEEHPEDFGITDLDRTIDGWVTRWRTDTLDENTRIDRLQRALDLMHEIDINVEFSNIEEVMDAKARYARKVDSLERRIASLDDRMTRFLALQEKVLRGEPIRKNPFADQVALVMCPVWGTEMPPLGIGYLEAFLLNQGWNPLILDFNIELFRNIPDNLRTLFGEDNFRHWTDSESFRRIVPALSGAIDALVTRLIDTGRKVIGFSVYSPNRLFTIEVCRRLKERAPDRVVVVGGRGVLTENERLLFPPSTVDYFVVGDGEATFVPLLEAIFAGRDGAKLPGVTRFEGHHLTPHHPRPIIEDLTLLPFPTYESFDLTQYTGEEIPILASRGCTGHCLFCNDHRAMGRFRCRPAHHIFQELMWHAQTHGRRKFKFNDQHVNGDLNMLGELCDLIIASGEQISFIALAQPRGDMPNDLMPRLKQAGCFTLNLGIESGSPSILKAMGKGFTVEDVERALRQIFEAGINTMCNFIVGYPGETEEDFRQTLEFVRRNRQWICGVTSVNTCIVLEESPLAKVADKMGIRFPDKNRDVGWWRAENTLALREDRARRLVALFEELQLPHLVSNLHEQVADLDALGLQQPPAETPVEVSPPHAPVLTRAVDESPTDPYRTDQTGERFDENRGKPYFETIDKSPADIMLLMLPVWGTDVPPLGLAYLAATIQNAGLRAAVLDLNIKLYNRHPDRFRLWRMDSYKEWTDPVIAPVTFSKMADLIDHYVNEIVAHPAPVLGFSLVTGNFPFTLYIAEKIRKLAPEKTIIFGGPGITNSFDIANVTRDQCDYLALGEGEEALVEMLRLIKKGRDPVVHGILEVGNPIDFEHLQKNLVRDVDKLPFPTYEQLNLAEYDSDAVPILTSRGCIRRCTFCNDHHIYQNKYRNRDPRKVFAEMEYHIKKRGAERFTMLDVLINGHPKSLEKLCDLIIASGYQICWGGQGVIRKEMTPELLHKMKAAGCMSMVYGVESFSDDVLRLMNKPYTRQLAKQVLQNTHDAGIETIINIIVGFPGESEKEYLETYEFIRDNQPILDQVASISPCLINLGSRLFEKHQEYGVLFPPDGKEGSIKWFTEDGNTFDVRRDRINRLTALLSEEDKSVHTVNLYDQEDKDENRRRNTESRQSRTEAHEPNNLDCLLVLMPPWGVDFPPLGLSGLHTYAQSEGYQVAMEDLNILWFHEAGEHFKQYWEPEHLKFWVPGQPFDRILAFLEPVITAWIDHAKSLRPDVVGFSTNESNLIITERIAKRLKTALPDSLIVFGGPGVAWQADRDRVDKTALDGFVIGEGEQTLVELLAARKNRTAVESIRGYMPASSNGEAYVERELMTDLDSLPVADFSPLPLHLYRKKELPLLFARGCPGRCAFCNDHRLERGKFRRKSPERLFEEVRFYKNRFSAFEFAFNDLCLNGDIDSLEAFCDLTINSEMRLAWTGQAMIHKKMTPSLMEKLHAAGCVSLVFGAESFSPNVLRAMKKRFEPDDAVKVFSAAKQADIEVIVNLIVGFPGETESDFNETLDFLRNHRDLIDRISALSTCIVVAQSELERSPDHFGIVLPKPEHWCQWYEKDGGNTYEIRTARLRRILDLLDELKIGHNMTNLYMEALPE